MRGKRTRRRLWILRGALATLGLAGVVYAADQAAAPAEDLEQTIAAQRVRSGQPVRPSEEIEHQRQALSPDEMFQVVATYDGDSKAAYEHGETARMAAYRAHDIIRMTCVDAKLGMMKEVMIAAEPRLRAFPRLLTAEILVIRQQFLVLQQAHNRITELAAELDGCLGDTLDSVMFGRVKEETTIDTGFDPTHPPEPTHDITRPPEASPYH